MTDNPVPRRTEQTPNVSRAARQNVFLSTTLERFGSTEVTRHRVRDLSPDGLRIDQADGLAKGATVLVAVGVLTAVAATVKWVANGHAGLAFDQQISPEQARGKVAIAPKGDASERRTIRPGAPVTGWVTGLGDPYRSRRR